MCGRYTRSCESQAIVEAFGVDEVAAEVLPGFNIAPGQDVAVIAGSDRRKLGTLRWGLKNPRGSGLVINARAETLAERPMFKGLLERRRCLIPADGFFEWGNAAGAKRPHYFYRKDRRPFAFAGLWDRRDVSGCVIVTTAANALVKPVHARMPVMLDPDAAGRWLETRPVASGFEAILKPFPAELMAGHAVSDLVNSVRNRGPEVVLAAE